MLKTLVADKRGGISILGGFMLAVLVGIAALAVEYGNGLLTQAQDQRVADLAAYSGALVYGASGNSATAANKAVVNIAALNGITSGVSSTIVTSPSKSNDQAVQVTIASSNPLSLARVINPGKTSLAVGAAAYAQIDFDQPACIIALNSSGTGITMSGGTAISAPGCTVASNSTVTVPCGDTITTKVLDSGVAPTISCSTGVEPPSGTASVQQNHPVTTNDPFAGTPSVTTATGRLSTVKNLTSPSVPTVPTTGQNVTFGGSSSTATTQSAVTAGGCSSSVSGSTWTVTCSGSGPFNFGTIAMGGGITVNFSTAGSSSAIYNFNGMINFSQGAAFNFGPGTFNIAQGIITGGGSTMSFGAGTFNIGTIPSGTCSINGESICHLGTSLTFGGPSKFTLSGGILVPGGFTLVMGAGSSNSFNIGADNNGNSLDATGGSKVTFADATGSGDLFQMAGNFNDSQGGGSCLTVSAATNHDINGFFNVAGGVTLGAGAYTVYDYVGIGVTAGGDVTCNGATVGVSAAGVTFVIGGNSTVSCGNANQVFCVGAGYAHVTITAPTTGTMQGLVVIGPTPPPTITAGADFNSGATNTTISGAFYFPQGQITMSGGATLGNGAGGCLELIGAQITMTGGTAAGTTCATASGAGGTSGTTISLVQ
jgi:hypothetical protein